MLSIGDIASQMNICKILAIALPRFYKKTKVSAQLVVFYDVSQGGLSFNLGFTPREATEQEYELLFKEIQHAEKIVTNDYVINNAGNFETIKQMILKHKEEINIILQHNKSE